MSKIQNLIDAHVESGSPEAFAAIVEYCSRSSVTQYSRDLAATYFEALGDQVPALELMPDPEPEGNVDALKAIKRAARRLADERIAELCGPGGSGFVRIQKSSLGHTIREQALKDVCDFVDSVA